MKVLITWASGDKPDYYEELNYFDDYVALQQKYNDYKLEPIMIPDLDVFCKIIIHNI